MNTQLKDLYRQASDAVEPAGDVTKVLAQARRRRVRTQVATPIAGVAAVASAVGLGVAAPWSDAGSGVSGADADFAAALPEPATVAGNTYLLDENASSGLPKTADVEITFHKGTYSASAGCNSFTGRYDMRDNVLVSSSTGVTMGFCPGRAGADEWLGSFLGSGPTVSIEGDKLRLNNGESDVTLAARQQRDKPLADTKWRLDSVVSDDVVASVPRGVKATLSLDDADRLAVSSDCATRTAEVAVSADSMRVAGDVSESASGACADPAIDRSVQDVLDGQIGYDIEGTQLRIETQDGALVYTAN